MRENWQICYHVSRQTTNKVWWFQKLQKPVRYYITEHGHHIQTISTDSHVSACLFFKSTTMHMNQIIKNINSSFHWLRPLCLM